MRPIRALIVAVATLLRPIAHVRVRPAADAVAVLRVAQPETPPCRR